MDRNTPILQEITDVLFTDLDEQATALNRLEHHYRDRLLLDVGDVHTVAQYAEQLRLQITEDERSTVLNHIAEKRMVVINVDVVEAATRIGAWLLIPAICVMPVIGLVLWQVTSWLAMLTSSAGRLVMLLLVFVVVKIVVALVRR